jgi:hypothetical protein
MRDLSRFPVCIDHLRKDLRNIGLRAHRFQTVNGSIAKSFILLTFMAGSYGKSYWY